MPSPDHARNRFLHEPQSPGPVFRVGIPGVSGEVMESGRRSFFWPASPSDERFADLAGWRQKLVRVHEGLGEFAMPESARSASSALCGVEAWTDEKPQILAFIAGYATRVHQELGVVDGNLSTDTVAVSRGNEEMLVVPPHNALINPEDIAAWRTGLLNDVDNLLANDPRREELMRQFDASLPFAEDVEK